ncbi:MAG: TolC family protein [Synergistaceae bacterium]|jgi:outer membrane protein TolC|nr:TolC family protein [Synergistaceae bacterium]
MPEVKFCSALLALRPRAGKLWAALVPLVLSFLFFAPSQSIAAVSMDIKEAIVLTLENNSELRSLWQETIKADAFRLQAEGAFLPEAAFNAYIDEQKENQTSDGSSRYDNRVARLTLSHTLYSGGKNQAMRRQSVHVKSIAGLNLADAENRATGELFARFYNVLLQERRIETERSAAATSELHLREVTRMSELGLSNRLEVIRASQSLATNKANLTSAEGARDAALISLMNYMAIPPEDRRPVSGDLRVMTVSGGRAESLAAAMAHRADREALRRQVEYQADQIEIERGGARPRVTLGASAGLLNPYRGNDSGDDTWRAELSITAPILDRNASRSGIIRAQAVIEQDKLALSQKDLDIKSGVETAWTELETAAEHLESTGRALELAEESLRLAEVGFQEGVTPQLDLLEAQTSLTEIRLEHLRSLYNHMLAVIALKVTEGNIVSWTEEMDF